MSKKIKNKILVNGKVFMPAKLNEEWLKEPARDESLKEIYNDDYFISLIPEGCDYFAIDEKNEKVYGLGFNYKEKMEKQIADLEEKLAESEKQNKRLYFEKEGAEKILRMSTNEQTREILELKQQLAEKDKEIEIVKNLKADEMALKVIQKHNQDKISFAVERLEKVKETIKLNYNNMFPDFPLSVEAKTHINIIDNQIEELKKEMK